MLGGFSAPTWEGLRPSCAEPMLPVVLPDSEHVQLKCSDCGLTTL